MKTDRCVVHIIFVLTVVLLQAASARAASSPDHRLWSALLTDHVREGQVDYQGFKRDEGKLDSYLQILDDSRPQVLGRADRLSYYINAYNAWTIKLILLHFTDGKPVNSIKDIGGLFSSPWKQKICRLGGAILTLDDIEHGIIRPEFKDPRIHFAVNCASKSCPPLLDTAYSGEKLELQLDAQATAFINDRRFNYLEGNTLYASMLFSWFEKDFGENIPRFIQGYASEGLKKDLKNHEGELKVKYLDYDWSLNSQ